MISLKSFLVTAYLFLFLAVSLAFSKTVYVIEFNDFHGMLYPTVMYNEKVPGAVCLANAILKEQEKDGVKNTVIVSGGDNYTGTIVAFDTKGKAINEFFKAIGVKVSAIGNHEFDWGQKYFPQWQQEGGFKYLSANVINENSSREVPSWDKPYEIVNVNGVKIAFIGLSTIETRNKSTQSNLKGLKIEDSWKAAKYWINYLKEGKDKEGKVDAIIALTHIPSQQNKDGKIEGKEIHELLDKTSGLDAVISAHSHKVVCGYINDIPVIQAKCYGERYGVLKIDVDDKTNKLLKITPEVYDVSTTVDTSDKNSVEKILTKYNYIKEKYSKIIGSTPGLSYSPYKLSPLGVFIAKCMTDATNSQIGLMNAFGIRSNIEKGDITLGEIYVISPFNNYLVTMNVTGSELKRIFEYGLADKVGCIQFYGINIKCDLSQRPYKRVVGMSLLNGKTIEMDKRYSICVNDFMATGGDGFKFNGATDIQSHKNIGLRDVIIKAIEKLKIVDPPSLSGLKNCQ